MFCYKLQNYFAISVYFNQYHKNMMGLFSAEELEPVIDTTQIGASQDFWGCGCCFLNPFKYCLQSAISIFANNVKVINDNGITICKYEEMYVDEETKKETGLLVVTIEGFGTSVFKKWYNNVFLNPDEIEPEQIAFFIKQLMEAINAYHKNQLTKAQNAYDEIINAQNTCHENQFIEEGNAYNQLMEARNAYNQSTPSKDAFNTLCSDKNMEFIVYSASAGSFVVLSSFLKNNREKEDFFKEVIAELFPSNVGEDERLKLQEKAQELMEHIMQEVNFVNPPGILFHAGLANLDNVFGPKLQPLLDNVFGLKLQSLAVGEQGLASEQYFIKMISEYLSGSFTLCKFNDCFHDSSLIFNNKNILISSVDDEVVFPFYYVAMFAKKLKELNYGLDDEQISNFVYKVMQYGNIVKDGDEFELDDFCKLAIDELKLSDNQHKAKVVSDMAQKYLSIRNSYLALQKEYRQSFQQEYCINILGINDGIKENNEKVRENFCEKANEIFTQEFGDVDATKPLFSIKKPNATASFAHLGDIDDCPCF